MQIVAKVTINNSSFEEWLKFFDGYKDRRSEFVSNEVVEKISDTEAKVSFDITDLDGLTRLFIVGRNKIKGNRIGYINRDFINLLPQVV